MFLNTSSVENIKLILNKSGNIDPKNPWNIPRFANVFKILSELNFFGKVPISYSFIDIKEPIDWNITIDKNYFLRTIVWPPSVIIHHILKFFNRFFSGKKKIFCLKKCEALRETIPWLQLKGYKIENINLPIAYNSKSNNNYLHNMESEVILILKKYFDNYFNEDQILAQKTLFLKHLNLGMNYVFTESKKLDFFFKKNFSKGDSIISSGFYGPIANQIFFLCKKYDVRLIFFEHGLTAGINFSTSKHKNFLESTTCNLLLVCSEGAKNIYDRANRSNKISKDNIVEVIGESDQKKHIYFKNIQKYFMKKRFNLSNKNNVIVHVSGLAYGGNSKSALDGPTESYLFDKEINLLEKVYKNVNKKVIYKKYPTQRLLYEPEYSNIKNLSSNIVMSKNEDFRYIRTVADIIVTDSTYSTLSWCLINNIPLVFLKSNICSKLISKKVEEYFYDSFLVVETDNINWEKELMNILNKPIDELRLMWRAKENKRQLLAEKYLIGSRGITGIRAANFVDFYIKNNHL